MTSSLSAPASTALAQNGATEMPGDDAGTSATPSSGSAAVLQRHARGDHVHRPRQAARLLGAAEPPAVLRRAGRDRRGEDALPRPALGEGARHEQAVVGDAVEQHPLEAVAVVARATRLATEKWCMVVATPSEGERADGARARMASSPSPPNRRALRDQQAAAARFLEQAQAGVAGLSSSSRVPLSDRRVEAREERSRTARSSPGVSPRGSRGSAVLSNGSSAGPTYAIPWRWVVRSIGRLASPKTPPVSAGAAVGVQSRRKPIWLSLTLKMPPLLSPQERRITDSSDRPRASCAGRNALVSRKFRHCRAGRVARPGTTSGSRGKNVSSRTARMPAARSQTVDTAARVG